MDIGFLIDLIIYLIVLGLLMWCIRSIPGLPAPIPMVLQILLVLIFAVYLLNAVSGLHLHH